MAALLKRKHHLIDLCISVFSLFVSVATVQTLSQKMSKVKATVISSEAQ